MSQRADSYWNRLLRKMAYQGRSHKPLRPGATFLSQMDVYFRGGGIIFLEEPDLFMKLLHDLGRVPTGSLALYSQELLKNQVLAEIFERQHKERNLTKYSGWEDKIAHASAQIALIYAPIRELQPKVVVETGTAAGGLASMILAAMAINGMGNLISIDIPPKTGELTMDYSIPEKEVGYFIPQEYRHRWKYVKGDAKFHLPRVLAENEVDFFIHDSLHTRTHMLFEYAAARALMRERAVIVSDDIMWNNTFHDFLCLNRLTGYAPFGNPNMGIFINSFDSFERQIGLEIIRV